MDYSPAGSSVHGILQAKILEWVAMPSTRVFSQPRDQTQVSALQADSLPAELPGKEAHVYTIISCLSSHPLMDIQVFLPNSATIMDMVVHVFVRYFFPVLLGIYLGGCLTS